MKKTSPEKSTVSGKKRRRSSSRESILECLSGSLKPTSVFEIIERLRKEGKRYNKTTIYREIETLKRMGNVKEIFFRNNTSLYELSGDHHHHLVCVSCGDIREVRINESLDKEERRMARREHFAIIEHSLEFFGTCERCR